jgi:hypothetical protein
MPTRTARMVSPIPVIFLGTARAGPHRPLGNPVQKAATKRGKVGRALRHRGVRCRIADTGATAPTWSIQRQPPFWHDAVGSIVATSVSEAARRFGNDISMSSLSLRNAGHDEVSLSSEDGRTRPCSMVRLRIVLYPRNGKRSRQGIKWSSTRIIRADIEGTQLVLASLHASSGFLWPRRARAAPEHDSHASENDSDPLNSAQKTILLYADSADAMRARPSAIFAESRCRLANR